ncbi:MAG: bifunctional isocitrate dehydrogenase kinase/phosphatase [Bacteroidota bacterium]
MFEKLLPYDVAHLILVDYLKYYHRFKRITKRAKIRFEHKDWQGIQNDARERILLYRNRVTKTTSRIKEFLQDKTLSDDFWRSVKALYFDEIRNFNTRNIAETFYNSIFRHYHQGLGASPDMMFVFSTGTYREFKSTRPIFHTFNFTTSTTSTLKRILSLYSFDAPYRNLDWDIEQMRIRLEKRLTDLHINWENLRLEILKSVFFRNKAAYLVGRIFVHDQPYPFVIPLLHRAEGIFIDTLLLDYDDVSSIFSYNRSYFLVDVDIVSETIDFLKPILPTKRQDELYNSIGFEKHGKTVFYRDFERHLLRSSDKFIIAPGIKGMVMSVFTLPSYSMVFKVIKDRFDPPKKVTERIVKEKYEMVNQHDRVGRMTDSHMFQNMIFDRKRFDEDLLVELQADAGSKIKITDTTVEIKHLYVEKRMIPLNMYLEQATLEEARHAMKEYGQSIKEMAAVNIFPGDMLLKNFGVTRLNRVVFYDYDEIGLLTDFNFRKIPEPRNHYEEFSSTPYYHVGLNDVFPEEFGRFLVGDYKIRRIFSEMHGDLFEADYWKGVQERLKRGEIIDVFPYREELRFRDDEKIS